MLIRGIVIITFLFAVQATNEAVREIEQTKDVLNRILDTSPTVVLPALCFLVLGDWVSTKDYYT